MNNTTTRIRRRATAALVLATAGGLAFVSNAAVVDDQAGAATAAVQAKLPQTPPAGKAWLQGVLTDQAGHPLDNVNVEVWSNDANATEPVASNLTYAGTSPRRAHGVYRVEVPLNQPYRLVFSAVGGQEDGDAYRSRWLGGGLPIQARTAGRPGGTPQAKASGRVRELGTTALVHQGKVSSHAAAGKAKTRAGKKATLKVRVRSFHVADPTGKVVVRVKGHKTTRRLSAANHGRINVKLPKLRRGTHRVTVRYLGSGTVRPSTDHTKVIVKRRK